MEKRYYFRGLGLGIIVTAVIMGIALSGSRQGQMTDDEIIARAKKLGMIEDSSLLEASHSDDEENEAEEAGEQETVKPPVKLDVAVAEQKPAETAEETPEADTGSSADTKTETDAKPSADTKSEADTKPSADTKPEADTKSSADTNEMTKQDDDTTKTPSQAASAAKSVTIVSGDGSYTVAKKLAEAGVVNSAASFDTFLCQNGYDKRLRTGTFQIPANASDEQIARIVTGQE